MGKIPPIRLQEIVLGSSDKAASKRIKSFEKQQLIKKIAPRIYTSNLEEGPETIIRRNWFRILAHQYPGTLFLESLFINIIALLLGIYHVTNRQALFCQVI